MVVDFSQAEAARNTAQTAASEAGAYNTKGITLADELRKALATKYGESGIPTDTAQARSNYMATPDQTRADLASQVKGGTIFSPSQQQAIMSSKLSSALVPLAGANMVNNAAYGGIGEMVDAGTRSWQAATQQKTLEAQMAQQQYENVLKQLTTQASMKEPEQLYGVNVPGMGMMNLSPAEAISLYGHMKSGAGGGGGGLDLSSLMSLMGGNNTGGNMGTEADYGEQPQYSPASGVGSTAVNDQGVVWEFGSDFKWYPIGRR